METMKQINSVFVLIPENKTGAHAPVNSADKMTNACSCHLYGFLSLTQEAERQARLFLYL